MNFLATDLPIYVQATIDKALQSVNAKLENLDSKVSSFEKEQNNNGITKLQAELIQIKSDIKQLHLDLIFLDTSFLPYQGISNSILPMDYIIGGGTSPILMGVVA